MTRHAARVWTFFLALVLLGAGASAQDIARGVVFEDRDGNGRRDAGEPGIGGVLVSNGIDVVRTDERGRYELPVTDDTVVFVVKPAGYATPVDGLNLPRFYYIHKPGGSPDADFNYPGVAPTGPLPESIDFPLRRTDEPERFEVVVLGDPQPYDLREVGFYARDTLAELIADGWGRRAAFGIVLGDLVGDRLDLFEPYNRANALVGFPWYNVIGNHDLNFKSPTDEHADETFQRVFGPSTYAFQHGRAHFISLHNVIWQGFEGYRDDGFPRTGNYRGGLREHQLGFIENYLAHVPEDDLVVLMMHIPLEGNGVHRVPEQRELFRILSGHPRTLSFSAHTHWQRHWFFDAEHGYGAGTEHHHLNAATSSGSWYRGMPDELGVPVSTMRCGAPKGYNILSVDGSDYTVRFKATRRPANHQMHIHAPDAVEAGASVPGEVVVNVFGGSEKSTVEMRIGGRAWAPMRHEPRPDPFMQEAGHLGDGASPPGRPLPDPAESHHIWSLDIPSGLPAGTHLIEIRSTDMFGRVDAGFRAIRFE